MLYIVEPSNATMDDLLIIIALILLNGIFSMSEVALISARKSKLTADAKSGNHNAATALKLQGAPDRFLSTIQIGITLIGILTGLFSGATLATEVGNYFANLGIEPHLALNLSRIIIVGSVTYLSIVVGELVPKRFGMSKADTIAKIVAAPMRIVKRVDREEWLVDGQCPVYDFLEYFDMEDLYKPSAYTTIGGLIIDTMRKVPKEGDTVSWNCFRFEVADIDRARVDKVAVAITAPDH